MKKTLTLLALICALRMSASDSTLIQQMFDYEMSQGDAYKNLGELCQKYPHRLSGSKMLEDAIVHCEQLMNSYDFDTVYRQSVMIPHWVRNDKCIVEYKSEGKTLKLPACALGGSIATPAEGIEAELEIIATEEDWEAKGKAGLLQDKIVFVNIAMSPKTINAFEAYGHCWGVRGTSAIKAARYGAKAVIIRSLSQTINKFPHTGVMFYSDTVQQIPAAAISTYDSEKLAEQLEKGPVRLSFIQNCETLEDKQSYNLIAEIRAQKPTDKYITIGGHLDCWDMGQGAHDDGAGVMHCLDALVLLQRFYTPTHNIRCVFYTNEENGSRGGKEYAKQAKLNGENHVYALESDIGGFVPRGIGMDIKPEQQAHYQSLIKLLRPYYMDHLEYKGGGVDIGPLRDHGTILSMLIIDSQRYFDVHHSDNDVFSNVNERELKLGAAGIAAWVYLLDKEGLSN